MSWSGCGWPLRHTISCVHLPRKLCTLTSISEVSRYQETIKKSRFVGIAAPAHGVKAAEEFLSSYSDPKATHNCFAWRLADGTTRYSGDGEPSGTAGPPILAAIERARMHGVVVLVHRFFGGVKLGTGGLVRAYGGVASRCLESATRTELTSLESLVCRFEPGDTGPVFAALAAFGPEAPNSTDLLETGSLCVEVQVPAHVVPSLTHGLKRATGGRVELLRKGAG